MQGLLAWKQGQQVEALAGLERWIQMLMAAAEAVVLGLETYVALDVARVLGLVRQLLSSLGTDPRQPHEAPAPILGKCMRYG
jgi:hypothetical protein